MTSKDSQGALQTTHIVIVQSMLYFAFASNMSSRQMKRRIGEYKTLGRGRLSGWRLAFNKRSHDETAKANIGEDANSVVWGVLYDITPADIANLDKWEPGYERISVPVILDSGGTIEAACYVAREVEDGLLPSRAYINTIVEGARESRLPKDYIGALEEILL